MLDARHLLPAPALENVLTPAVAIYPEIVRDNIERVRRAHRNDLENVLPFFGVGLLYLLTRPSLGAARVYFIGFLVARVLHSVFYVASLQPHRTIAFAVGGLLMLGMVVQGLAHFLT